MHSKLLVSLVVLLVLAAACAPRAVNEVEQIPQSAPAANIENPAGFEVKLYQGQQVYGGDILSASKVFDQGKPVVVGFYAGMCPGCMVELPRLQAASDKYAGQVNFILMDIGPFVGLGTELDGANMLKAVEVEIPGGTPLSVEVIRDYGVLGTPSAFFFRTDGTLHFHHSGVMTEAQIDEAIAALLQ